MPNEKKNIAFIVVVYNKHCADSLTCRALAGMCRDDITVVVYDNSTTDFGNRSFCEEKSWHYFGNLQNDGLSVAYNQSITFLISRGFDGIICLFDDDTVVEESYLEAVASADWESHNIYVPFIYANSKLISPCIHKDAIGYVFEDEQQARSYTGNDLSAINSAMAIKSSLFHQYRYDEKIFLDGIDHKFVRDMAARGEKLGFLDYHCRHEFFDTSHPGKKSAYIRFKIYAKDIRYIYRKRLFAYIRDVGYRAAHLSKEYRSPIFIVKFIQYLFSCN